MCCLCKSHANQSNGINWGEKKSHGLSEPSLHFMLASEEMLFFFFKAVFCLKLLFCTGSLSRTESVSQLGSFHLSGPCVNREVCFKLCQRGLVGSYHTLARLAKASVGGGHGGSGWQWPGHRVDPVKAHLLSQSGYLTITRTDEEPSLGWESDCKILDIRFENSQLPFDILRDTSSATQLAYLCKTKCK